MKDWAPLAAPVEINDMRFYISNVRLVNDKGAETPVELEQDGLWQVENVALLDFEDAIAGCAETGASEMNVSIRGIQSGWRRRYPRGNRGVYEITGKTEDMGRFRPPTLRNVALTAPYMHEGSIATLEDVVRHYMAGGRVIEEGPFAGDGRRNPYKSGLVSGFRLDEQEIADLIAFLESLTDESFVTDPRFSNPFEEKALDQIADR